MENITKQQEYAIKLTEKISQLFDEDDELHIEEGEFETSENATAFIHALVNLMPCVIYNRIVDGKKVDLLEFNHIANRLVHKFSNK